MLSVHGSRELRAVVAAMKGTDRTIRNDINRATRATLTPAWQEEVRRRVSTPTDRKVLETSVRVLPGNPPVVAAAGSRRKLSGGLVPSETWRPFEFGALDTDKVTTYHRSGPGKGTTVTRHASRQLPARRPKGRVLYRALGAFAPRAAALWAQIIVKKYADAMDGR